jgi:hypothetical protein
MKAFFSALAAWIAAACIVALIAVVIVIGGFIIWTVGIVISVWLLAELIRAG